MEPLTKDQELLEQFRNESLDRRYGRARRAHFVFLYLGLLMFCIMGVVAFSEGSLLSGGLAMAFCVIIVAGHIYSMRLTKEAFLASKAPHKLSRRQMMILAVIGAILAGYLLRTVGS